MNREIKITTQVPQQTITIHFILHGEKQSVEWSLRCPSPSWNYYLNFGINIHRDYKTEEQDYQCDCTYRPSGKCYCDGSSVAGEDLQKEFLSTGNQELIWAELEKWMN